MNGCIRLDPHLTITNETDECFAGLFYCGNMTPGRAFTIADPGGAYRLTPSGVRVAAIHKARQ